jgi:hypothetical protein
MPRLESDEITDELQVRPTMMAVAEDVRLKRLAAELSEREGTLF